MEREKIIFFRNFLLRAFVIGLAFALFYFGAAYLFWNVSVSWAHSMFKVDEKQLGQVVLQFFLNVRIVLVFLFLVPALALHWSAKKK